MRQLLAQQEELETARRKAEADAQRLAREAAQVQQRMRTLSESESGGRAAYYTLEQLRNIREGMGKVAWPAALVRFDVVGSSSSGGGSRRGDRDSKKGSGAGGSGKWDRDRGVPQEQQWARSENSHKTGSIRRREDEFALLNRAEKAFTKSKDDDNSELAKVSKAIMIILNRLAPSNFSKLSGEMVAMEIKSKAILEQVRVGVLVAPPASGGLL